MPSEATRALISGPETGLALVAGPLEFRQIRFTATPVEAPPVPAITPMPVDTSAMIKAAREEGRQQAGETMQAELERRLQVERANVLSALDAFVAEKRRYFSSLEQEVVRLALAIAERVLHRETSMDPTLLAGAARVVLEQVDHDSVVTLLVAPEEAEKWSATVVSVGKNVSVREESSLSPGECRLETEAGSFELGVRSQLLEIERGFFELLGRNPAVTV